MNNESEASTFFPLLIRYKGSDSTVVVKSREEIESGKSFHVLDINYVEP